MVSEATLSLSLSLSLSLTLSHTHAHTCFVQKNARRAKPNQKIKPEPPLNSAPYTPEIPSSYTEGQNSILSKEIKADNNHIIDFPEFFVQDSEDPQLSNGI